MHWCNPNYTSIYKSLNETRRELCLVSLLPRLHGREGAPIVCELATFGLCEKEQEKVEDSALPGYEALSYEWGSPTGNKYEIQLQGQPFLVRENLWLALQHLRSSKRRVFWIDAICVNQEDMSERSHQVGLMETIYTRATKVHVMAWARV